MKILYLDLNVVYHNFTRNNIPLLLKTIANTDYYGHGYQPNDLLKDGVEKFYYRNDPYDFVITNEHIVFCGQKIQERYDKLIDAYKKNYYFQFDACLLKDSIQDMDNFFEKIDPKKRRILC